MKILFTLLTAFLATTSIFAQNNNQTSSNTPAVGNYLVLTEANNNGTFTLAPGEMLCVRFEDSAVTTTTGNSSFQTINAHSFDRSNFQNDFLELSKILTGNFPDSSADNAMTAISSLNQWAPAKKPDSTQEKEWIFEQKAAGETTLTFCCTTYNLPISGNGPIPQFVAKKTITFTIITK